jgi:glycosyltransferase involved in cell wall biosynthesis
VKVAFVTPRYGPEIAGGAEMAIRMVAEHLAARPGWQVSALTTCARDSRTWADEYPPGSVDLRGVEVHRFPSERGRDPKFDAFSAEVMGNPHRMPLAKQREWIERQGPVSSALLAAIGDSDADLCVFSPYLFHPTIHGVPAARGRAVLHPAAHDEPPLRLPLLRRVMSDVRGMVFYTHVERQLTERRFRTAATPHIVLGLGIEEHEGDAAAARAALGIDDAPYLLCVGRVDPSKGTTTLGRFFADYKERHPGPLKLVLVGQIVDPPEAHPDIVLTGLVPDDVKWGALRGATAYVTPSAYESFSLVVLESWVAGVPVLVNARCGATREHCERSGGGLWFDDYAHFEVAVDRLLGDDALRARLVERGRAYVDENFRWPVLIDRYAGFLERVQALGSAR